MYIYIYKYVYIYMYIHIYTYIWRCPKIGLPLYKSSIYSLGFAMKTMHRGVRSSLWGPNVRTGAVATKPKPIVVVVVVALVKGDKLGA